VERYDQRNPKCADEVEDEAAILAAPDALAVLQAYYLHAAFVERICGGRVVGLDVAPDSVADLGRIRAGLAGRVDGYDLAFADRSGQVVREGRNAALAGRVG
jgi:hypothetical protein